MQEWLEIRKYTYLKNPKWKWTICNSVGGSFSNSGEYRTLKALAKAFKAQYPDKKLPVKLCTIHGFKEDNSPVESVYELSFEDTFGK